MYCTQCQHELPDGALFCELCGARQNDSAIPREDEASSQASDASSEHANADNIEPERVNDEAPPPNEEPETPSNEGQDQNLFQDEDENAPLPELETMLWTSESVPTVTMPGFPENPKLERGVIISIAIISIAVAILLILATAWALLRLLQF